MKQIIILLITISLLFGQSFVRDLKEIANVFEKEYKNKKEAAVLKAVEKNWPIKGKNNGSSYELMELAPNGMPIYYTTENINSARTISTDLVWPGGEAQMFLTGQGMTVGIWDNGKVRNTHQELVGRVQQMDGATELGDHATHVGGTMIAAGVINTAHGMAHEAQLHAYEWGNDDSEMATAAANGLGMSNHSYTWYLGWRWNYFDDDRWAWFGDLEVDSTEDYKFGFYNEAARDWDIIAHNAPYYLIVHSAGNERNDSASPGTEHWVYSPADGDWILSTDAREPDGPWDCLGHTKTAKNVFTVGAVEDIAGGYEYPSQVQLTSFSSGGPLDDGRIKPDIVANGSGLHSCLEQSDTDYGTYSGTSMAAPSTAGSLTLVRQHYETVMDTTIRAATLKGLAIHTADEAGAHEGPDYKFGWGLMNTKKAVKLISEVGDGHVIIENELPYLDSLEYEFTSLGADPFRTTLSWSDPPGTPVAASLDPGDIMLVHDLDLRVIDPNGQVHFPYKLNKYDPTQAAFTGDNIVDNVEQVFIDLTTPGTYTVRVKHKGILQSDQPFGLIVSYGTSIPEIVHVTPDGNDATGDGSTDNPFESIQAALDFSGMGDTILVAPGEYIENIEINNQNCVIASYFLLAGDSSYIENTVIDGGGQGQVISMNMAEPNTKLIGFTITNGYTTDSGAGLYCVDSYPTIAFCVFKDNNAGISNPLTHGGSISANYSEITLENVWIYDNYAAGQGGAVYAAHSTINATHVLAVDNVSNVKGGAFSFYKSSGTIDHVTIANDSAQIEGGALFMHESEVSFTNSIVWGSSPQQIAFSEYGGRSFVNINFSILDEFVTGVETNNNGTVNFGLFDVFDDDPLFCAVDSGDYQLAENSPCVGFGNDGTTIGFYGIGCGEIVAIDDELNTPRTFELHVPYPNPFNATTTIRFTVEDKHSLLLRVYDITGRLVATLIDEHINPGEHEINWHAENVSSGLYFVQLQSGNNVQTQKLILLK